MLWKMITINTVIDIEILHGDNEAFQVAGPENTISHSSLSESLQLCDGRDPKCGPDVSSHWTENSKVGLIASSTVTQLNLRVVSMV